MTNDVNSVTLVHEKGDRVKAKLVPVSGLNIGGTYSVSFRVASEGEWQLQAELIDGTVLSSAASIHASHGPLTAAECVLLGSAVDTVTQGTAHKLLIQPAQWGAGELRPYCLQGLLPGIPWLNSDRDEIGCCFAGRLFSGDEAVTVTVRVRALIQTQLQAYCYCTSGFYCYAGPQTSLTSSHTF